MVLNEKHCKRLQSDVCGLNSWRFASRLCTSRKTASFTNTKWSSQIRNTTWCISLKLMLRTISTFFLIVRMYMKLCVHPKHWAQKVMHQDSPDHLSSAAPAVSKPLLFTLLLSEAVNKTTAAKVYSNHYSTAAAERL